MTLNLISLATVKTELGISDTDSDAAITAMIPKVSSDVRRILNDNFDSYIDCVFATTADTITPVYSKLLDMGQVVYHPNLPADTYVTGVDPDTGVYTISATPTDDGLYVNLTVTIAQWSAIAKMIWFRIQGLNITDYDNKTVASETYGKISKTYADSEINKKWNYPQELINGLGIPKAKFI